MHRVEAQGSRRVALLAVLLFWLGYVAITLGLGIATSPIADETWRLTAWGFLSGAGLIALTRRLRRGDGESARVHGRGVLARFAVGFLVGAASFGVHLAVVHAFAGPFVFERVPAVGPALVALFLLRFVATSFMEELGFHGFALDRLELAFGALPAVCVTAVAFGLSHLLYGWDLVTILVGVVPAGLL